MTCIRIDRGFITVDEAVKARPRDREAEVLDQIRTFGGFTVFWATENQARAQAIDRLGRAGRIRRIEGGSYPWCPHEVVER